MRGKHQAKVGDRFYHWTVKAIPSKPNSKGEYLFQCDCGRVAVRRLRDIKAGKSKSCGKCGHPQPGETFGNVLVCGTPLYTKRSHHPRLECICLLCGSTFYPHTGSMVKSDSFSCGCDKIKKSSL